MNEIIAEFSDYLLNTKNYSTHTVTAYDTDIRDFLNFYTKFSTGTVGLNEIAGRRSALPPGGQEQVQKTPSHRSRCPHDRRGRIPQRRKEQPGHRYEHG